MKVGIVASDQEEWHVQRLLGELRRREAEAYILPATRFLSRVASQPKISVRGWPIDDYDAIIVRKIPGSTAERVFYRMDVLHRFEDMGIYVINPAEAIEKAVDKFYTSALLEKTGINTPKTVVTERFNEAMEAFHELGMDVVVKPLFGSLGMGMARISDEDTAYRVFKALDMVQGVFYLQEFIPHSNEDIRAFVIDDIVVASMLRTSPSWKTNISAGGSAKPYRLQNEMEQISKKATKTIGLEYSGVDLLVSENDGETYVIELNSTPGWRGLQTVTEKDITSLIVDYIEKKVN